MATRWKSWRRSYGCRRPTPLVRAIARTDFRQARLKAAFERQARTHDEAAVATRLGREGAAKITYPLADAVHHEVRRAGRHSLACRLSGARAVVMDAQRHAARAETQPKHDC